MECLSCHAVNSDDRRFCSKCGEVLPQRCPGCETINFPGDEFCGQCGAALYGRWAARPRRQHGTGPERRQLTVMFCDLVGSTTLARELDPEDFREVILDYQETTRQIVDRYEGYVARYMGDGVLAYFGYPRAHEDDAARAILAGLALIAPRPRSEPAPGPRATGYPRLRVGIATGVVVVGDLIGEQGSEEAAAVGESVHLASRLQSLAAPDSVVVSEATRQLTQMHFVFADHGTHALKGFDRPVQAWQVVRAHPSESRFDAVRARGMTSFVGRAEEMRQILAQWAQAKAGAGQVLMLSGEAGIGKSRIVETFAERTADDGRLEIRYQCSPYHTGSALYPFIERLKREAGFADGEGDAQKLDKLAALLEPVAIDDSAKALFAALLSLPAERVASLTPAQKKSRTLAALAQRLYTLADEAPIVLIVEDAHWIDPTSMELLDLMVRELRERRVLMLITSRSTPRSDWLALDHAGQLSIERLSEDDAAAMVRSLLDVDSLPAKLVGQIMRSTDGVPLFIEEVVKALEARAPGSAPGAATPMRIVPHEVPLTLQDSLMARLDRLGTAKQVAQFAAVIGREFSRTLLSELAAVGEPELGEALDRLRASAVLFSRGHAPWDGYVFKHALVQEAAYGSLLRSKRQELHRRVAELLESHHPERVIAEPEVLAYHFAQAGQDQRAASYWAAAAKRALDRSANLEALSHSASGLALLDGLPSTPERDLLQVGLAVMQGTAYRAVEGFASPNVELSFLRALALCERLGDIARLVDVRRGMFSFYYARGDLDRAEQQGHEIMALAETTGDRSIRMIGCWMVGCMAAWRGNFRHAQQALDLAISLYHPEEQVAKTLALQIDPRVNALSHLCWVQWILGMPEQAIATGAQAVLAARALNQPLALAMSLFFSCVTRACTEDFESAAGLQDELIAVTTEHGLGYLGSCAKVLKGQALIAGHECVAGIAQVELALAEFKTQEAALGVPWSMSILASGYAELGRVEEGLDAVTSAFEAIQRHGEHHWEAEVWRWKGELLRRRPHPDAAAAAGCFERAIEVARSQSARSLEIRATVGLARLRSEQGGAQ